MHRLPFFHVWDDHDFGANNSDQTFPGKEDALHAFREYFPTPFLPSSDGIWPKFRYAEAEFFVLDLPSRRDPNIDPPGPQKSILGAKQKEWLKETLLNSTARWKFLISSVPFNPDAKPNDSWAAFQTERAEIVDFIANHKITGILVISGDMHTGGALDDGSNSGFPELQVPYANLPTPVCHSAPVYKIGSWSLGILCGIDNSGYGLITVIPDSVVLQAKGVDGAVRLSFTVGGDH